MRKDAKENQREILVGARQLFDENGVAAVSMNQIAKTLGIGAGTLYRHYANKSALCMALVYDDLTDFVTSSREYLTVTDQSARTQFRYVLNLYLQFREQNMALLTAVDTGNESAQGSYFYTSDHYQDVVAVFSRLIKMILPNLSTEESQFRADMLIAMLKSDAYAFQRRVRRMDQRQLIDHILALVVGEGGAN